MKMMKNQDNDFYGFMVLLMIFIINNNGYNNDCIFLYVFIIFMFIAIKFLSNKIKIQRIVFL